MRLGKCVLTASVFSVLGLGGVPQVVIAAPPPPTPIAGKLTASGIKVDEILVGPISATVPIQGINVTIVSSTYLTMQTTSAGLVLKARVSANLQDLQAKIGSIIDTIKLPRDNCASFTLTNPVVTIWGKELQATPGGAVLWLHGYVDVWQCVRNPVSNSKLVWRNDGPFHARIPHVQTWPGDPLKNKGVTQPFDISEPLQLTKMSDTAVGVSLGAPSIKLGGQFVDITNGVLRLAGVNINEKANDLLRKAVDPAKLQVSVPAEYVNLGPRIESASLKADGSSLIAEIAMSALLPSAQITGVLQGLISKMKPQST